MWSKRLNTQHSYTATFKCRCNFLITWSYFKTSHFPLYILFSILFIIISRWLESHFLPVVKLLWQITCWFCCGGQKFIKADGCFWIHSASVRRLMAGNEVWKREITECCSTLSLLKRWRRWSAWECLSLVCLMVTFSPLCDKNSHKVETSAFILAVIGQAEQTDIKAAFN